MKKVKVLYCFITVALSCMLLLCLIAYCGFRQPLFGIADNGPNQYLNINLYLNRIIIRDRLPSYDDLIAKHGNPKRSYRETEQEIAYSFLEYENIIYGFAALKATGNQFFYSAEIISNAFKFGKAKLGVGSPKSLVRSELGEPDYSETTQSGNVREGYITYDYGWNYSEASGWIVYFTYNEGTVQSIQIVHAY